MTDVNTKRIFSLRVQLGNENPPDLYRLEMTPAEASTWLLHLGSKAGFSSSEVKVEAVNVDGAAVTWTAVDWRSARALAAAPECDKFIFVVPADC